MKRDVLILVLVVVFVGWVQVAFAATDSASQNVRVVVPGIFWIGWSDDPTREEGNVVEFNLGEDELLGGGYLERLDTDILSAVSNYNATDIVVSNPFGWIPDDDGDGDFDLYIDWGAGYRKFPLGGTNKYIVKDANGLNGDWNISYKLEGFGMEDDPDTYRTYIYFTLKSP